MAHIPEPGDPDFDWSKYDQYHAANDPVAAAKRTLEATAPQAKEFADITAQQFPAAAAVRQAHPGAYDDMTDAELEQRVNAKNRGEGYHPGLSSAEMPEPQINAMLHGFLSGAASGATSPMGKAVIGGASALVPGGPIVAAGTEALAEALGVGYGNKNAPQSLGEAATGVAEPAIEAGGLQALPTAGQALRAIPRSATGIAGAGLGAYRGYKRGGIPGAIEEGVIGGMAGAALPRSVRALKTLLGGAGAAAPVAAEELPMVTATGEEIPREAVVDSAAVANEITKRRAAGLANMANLPEAWKPFVRR